MESSIALLHVGRHSVRPMRDGVGNVIFIGWVLSQKYAFFFHKSPAHAKDGGILPEGYLDSALRAA